MFSFVFLGVYAAIWAYCSKNIFKQNRKSKWLVVNPEILFGFSDSSLLILDLSPRVRNILIKVPELTINRRLINCTVCDIKVKKKEFQYPGDFNDCFLTTYFGMNPKGGMRTTVGRYDKTMLLKTTRLYNQKSQIIIFVNFDVAEYENNMFNVYRACNANFVKVFQLNTSINRGIIFILRNAVYYEFIRVNRHMIKRVLTFDFSDTIFTEDPFGILRSDTLYVSVENYNLRNPRFGNRVRNINNKFLKTKCDLNGARMINGGFMAGYHTYVAQYLKIFLNYFTKNQSYAEDQFYFNFMFYCRKMPEVKVTILDEKDGFVHYCYYHKRINDFPPNETHIVSYFHQWNRNDCHGGYPIIRKLCCNLTTISQSL